MTARTRRLAAVLAGIAATAMLMAGPAHALGGKKGRVDTKPGCFGAGSQGHTRERLEQARGLKILGVHEDVTGIKEMVRLKFTFTTTGADDAVHIVVPVPAWRPY